mmetsp:Transcript_33063/g.98367  ORF Transcript_33063/g.98367 Transcript_33063/m.98367 type:complete len:604 (-) Transcript_33063:331-2142(-)
MVFSFRNDAIEDVQQGPLTPRDERPAPGTGPLRTVASNYDKAATSHALASFADGTAVARVSTEAHRRLAVSLNNTATLHHQLGDYERALRFYQECVQARMEALSHSSRSSQRKTPPSQSSSAERLESALARCQAVQAEERALRAAVRAREEPQPACLDMYPRAGTRHEELEAAFLPPASPVEIPLHRGGPVHQVQDPGTSDDTRESSVTLHNMGLSHLRSKSVAKASQLFDMSLSVYGCGTDPTLAAQTLNLSAQAHVGRGALHEASDALSEALRLWRESAASTSGSPSRGLELGIADTLSLMGRIQLAAGDADRSLELARQALRLRRSALGDDHVVVAATLYSIGLVLREKGHTSDAVEHVRWFVHHSTVNTDPRYRPHLAEAVHTLGLLCLDCSETTRAVEVFSRCVEVRASAHGNAHPALADDLLQLGRVLHDLGRFRDAMERYRAALSIETALARRQEPAPQEQQGQQDLRLGESEGVATALCSIGQIYQALEDHSRALRCFEDVLRISRALFGPEDEFVASMLSVIGNVRLEMGETQGAVEDFANAERIVRRLQEQGQAEGMDESGSRQRDGAAAGPIVVPNLLQAMGIDFHPHAAAA